jgi:hypothetical protein
VDSLKPLDPKRPIREADIGKLAGVGSGQPAQVHYEVTLFSLRALGSWLGGNQSCLVLYVGSFSPR